MKKILYVVSTLRKTGPTNQLYEMVKYLPKTEYIVRILTLSPEIPENSRRPDFEGLKVEVQSLELGRLQGMFLAKRMIREIIREFVPDIVHSCGIRADMFISSFKKQINWCATIHCDCEEDYILRYGPIVGRIYSDTLKSTYELKLNKRMYAIQNGIDVSRFCYDEKKRACLRKKYGILKDSFLFVSVGSLSNRKDPLTIINAFQRMEDKNSKLYILGDGPLKEICEVNQSNGIILEGRVDQVEEYLLIADVFVSASLSEGLPYSVLEAGAAGLPMILSDIPQHREIWCDETEYVQFFHTGDVEMLEKKMKKIESIGNNEEARKEISKSIISRFSGEKMSWNYQCFYKFMLNKSE